MKKSNLLNIVLAVTILALLAKYNLFNDTEGSGDQTVSQELIQTPSIVDTNITKVSYGRETVLFPMPANVIGSYDKDGTPNVMTAAWSGICNSNPPSIAVSLREATYTYGNIMEQKAFTVNVPSEQYVREVDYMGIYSGRDENKFKSLGLTAVRSDSVNAPYVKEFPINIECRLIKAEKLGKHTQFIGEIIDVKVNSNCLDANNHFIIDQIRPVIWGKHHYYGFGKELGKSFSIGKELKAELEKGQE